MENNEIVFIYMGLRKDKLLFASPGAVKIFLENPERLDEMGEEVVRRFWFYYDWYHRQKK